MARDMTVRELRSMLEGVPDHWPVMLMLDDDGVNADCTTFSVQRSHVDYNTGCEGVWLYNIISDTDNPDVDWHAEYGMPPRKAGEDDLAYSDRLNVWERSRGWKVGTPGKDRE